MNHVARWGFDPVDVLDAVHTSYGGGTVGQVYDGNRPFDVSVVLAPDERRTVRQLGDLPLRSPEGNYVPLRQLADIYETSRSLHCAPPRCTRVQTITCSAAGRDVTSFVAEAKQRVAGLALPPGAYIEFAGTAAAQAQSRRDLLTHSLLAGLCIILLLSIVMGSYTNLLVVLANLPFALVGGVFAAFVTGGVLSIGSLAVSLNRSNPRENDCEHR